MKRYMYVFVISVVLIVCSKWALAAPPRFFEPEKVAYKSVDSDSYRTTGLWKMKNRGLNGYACVFQNEDDDTYNTGAREQGELVYGPFEIPDEPDVYLSFWYLWEVEASLNYDKMSVEISSNDPDGPYTILRDNRSIREHHSENEWACMKWIDLSAYRGETVYIRFYFDTVDAIYNNYRGWLIDIITIYRNHFASVFKPQWILDISLDEFDQSNGTARDYSGHNHHGTIQDPRYRSTHFKHEVNGSLRINKNNKIVVPDSPEFGALRSLAIDFWFYPEDYGIIASRENQFKIRYASPGKLWFYVFDGQNWGSGWTDLTFPKNKWYHISLLYDGRNRAIIYVNGIEYKFISSWIYEMAPGSGDLYIGGSWESNDYNFTGYMGDFRMADIEDWLTTEVRIMHNAPDPAIYHWDIYRFNDWSNEYCAAGINENLFGGSYDITNPNIQGLIASIGVDPDISYKPEEVWNKLQAIWIWLQENNIPTTDPRYHEMKELLPDDRWPTIQERADQYVEFGGYIWQGSCGAYAQFFGSLMRVVGIDPTIISFIQIKHLYYGSPKPHALNAVFLYGRWLIMDATGFSGLDFPDFPHITSMNRNNPTYDHEHPWDMKLPPGGIREHIPLMNRGIYPDPLPTIRITSPPNGAIMDQDTILVCGDFSGPDAGSRPQYVLINGKKVNVHKNNNFITSIPTHFIDNTMEISVTLPDGTEGNSVFIYNQ